MLTIRVPHFVSNNDYMWFEYWNIFYCTPGIMIEVRTLDRGQNDMAIQMLNRYAFGHSFPDPSILRMTVVTGILFPREVGGTLKNLDIAYVSKDINDAWYF